MINVDLQELLPESFPALFGEELVAAILDDVAAAARAKWIRLAQQQLGTSKRDYIEGIQGIEGRGNERFITLLGQLPNMIEQGVGAWDLRTTLLGQGKGKVSKDGHRYRAIPFRHGTPGSKGQAGTPMGARYGPQGAQSEAWAKDGVMDQGRAAALGKAVYAAVKQRKGQAQIRTGAKSGRTIVDMGRGPVRVPKLAPWHSTDIYAGMRRTQKKYQTATQSQYTTFRMISEANPVGWIHPGIQARNLHQEVEQHVGAMVGKIVGVAISRALRGAGG